MSNNNENIHENQAHQVDGDQRDDLSPQGSPRGSREGTPNDQSEHVDGRDEVLQKIIDVRVEKALEALIRRLPVAPSTPNDNTLENPRSGLINSGNGETPSDSQEGEPGNSTTSHWQNLVLTLQKQLKEQNERIEQIPGVPPVIRGVDMDKYSQQPWKPSVAPLPIPKKFKIPDIPKYDGITDPRDHVTAFTTDVKGNDLTKQEIESVEKRMKDIFKIKQGDSELLRDFVDRFQRERMTLPRVPDNWAAVAFASNLNDKSSEATRKIKESLREFSTTTWNDVYNRYNTKLRIEEDTVPQFHHEESNSSRRSEIEKRSGKNRYDPYMGPAGKDSRSKHDSQRYDKKSRNRESGSSSRFLQSEVDHLLKQGYLTELFSEKGKQAYMKNRQEPLKPPSPKRTVNVISGGEDIHGVTYTASNKVSKVTITHGKRVRQDLENESISFDDIDTEVVMTPHNDTLVISLLVHDTNVKSFD
ncbi:uncharacterized protein [Nicotiana sylvestris]|uniref:uncharacterized protein n=1 Tax=Nicotiana sylvestris TaxID=4096 RepID=UPI00388C6746